MEELRIKCPSCGIALEVRNSKNEAVKRITCPNCKKHLAVTFHEEPKPAQYVEIKMVQLADGSQKTIVRALTDDHVITINGERLMKDDEVVLTHGDNLEIDGKPQFAPKSGEEPAPTPAPTLDAPASEGSVTESPAPDTPTPKRNNWYLSVALIAVIVAAFVLWQKFAVPKPEDVPVKPTADTITTVPPRPESGKLDNPKAKKETKKNEAKPDVQPKPTKQSLSGMSEYDLERLAMKGDAEAQCLLGKRWANRGDSTNVVKGIKYLKQAANNGSSEAKAALRKVYATLQQSAANGSTTASNILREQR
jgi:hypothetical protein